MGKLWNFFELLGDFIIPYWLLHWISFFLNGFRSTKLPRFQHPGRESWALVTGATDGIGEGLAHELAERGFNVILHGRNAEKLKSKAAKLQAAYPRVKHRVWLADATEDVSRETLLEAVKDTHLTVLINNVGGVPPGFDAYAALGKQPFKHIDRTIAMNLGFATKIEATLLPILIQNQPSAILNISSLATLGAPYLSVYIGSKGYLNTHSLGLQAELNGMGKDVTVHSVLAGKVATAALHVKPALATPDARTMAKATLDHVGLGGRVVITPYLPQKLQAMLLTLMPERVMLKLMYDATMAAESEDIANKKLE